MKLEKIKYSIKNKYLQELEEDLLLLAVCGSLSRGNYVPGWSDADLLLVLKKVTASSQKRIFRVKKNLESELHIDVDPFVISKENLLAYYGMHGKLINYLFFISQADVMVNRGITLPLIGLMEYKRNLLPTVIEYQKNMRKSIMEIKYDEESLRKHYRRNIKLTFLVLKRLLASTLKQPNTYSDIIKEAREKNMEGVDILENYNNIREQNLLGGMCLEELFRGVENSFNFFEKLTNNILTNERSRTENTGDK